MSEPPSASSVENNSTSNTNDTNVANSSNSKQSKRDNNYHVYPIDMRNTYHSPASSLSYKSKQIIRQAQDPAYATAPRIAHFLYEVFIIFFLFTCEFIYFTLLLFLVVFIFSLIILCILFFFSSSCFMCSHESKNSKKNWKLNDKLVLKLKNNEQI